MDPPTIVDPHGNQFWLKNGRRHREGGPAVMWANGDQEWSVNGHLHRDGGPALICVNGYQEWYQNGQRHRDGDQPAVIFNTFQEWYQNGQRHRDGDQPAMICADGFRAWYQHDQLHRDGSQPAVIWEDGRRNWYHQGIQYTPNISCMSLKRQFEPSCDTLMPPETKYVKVSDGVSFMPEETRLSRKRPVESSSEVPKSKYAKYSVIINDDCGMAY